MTRQHVVVLGLEEIVGIRWECDTCHSAISFRLDQTVQIPQGCPGCGAVFVDAKAFADYETVMRLINTVKDVRATGVQKRIKATVKLEINDGTA